MRYSKEHKQETRQRIVHKAAERFRAEGVDAVGVASLMESVGLTVGGFYSHFDSKEDLIAQACSEGFAASNAGFRHLLETKPQGQHVPAVVTAYLSKRHRDAPGQGCFAAANGAELARHPAATRAVFTQNLKGWIAVIKQALKADGLVGDARGITSAMVGAMVLARAVDDPALSDAFLASGRATILASLAELKPQLQ